MANQYVNKLVKDGVTKFDLTSDTVTPETLAEGVTAHDASGAQIVGVADVIPPTKLGLRADFVNKTFTRLGDAEGLSGGSDFDNFPMYKRRRCNLADDGTVNAYLEDDNYAVDGSNGQVMVEQPKFYYKVVPLEVDNYHLNKVEYWISDKPLSGYKLHPAFRNTSGQETDYFYEGAYEGYVSNNKLGSISGVAPANSLTRAQFRTYANNRGNGWCQETIWSLSADQLLMIIEYGKFNMQEAIGNGNVDSSITIDTGTLDTFGNASYGVTDNKTTAVQWRGKENPWGNLSTFTEGIVVNSQDTYIANTYQFDDLYASSSYSRLFYTYSLSGYIKSFYCYKSDYDWWFCSYGGSYDADSSLPVGDYLYAPTSSSARTVYSGGAKTQSDSAGAFCVNCRGALSGTGTTVGARLLYVG